MGLQEIELWGLDRLSERTDRGEVCNVCGARDTIQREKQKVTLEWPERGTTEEKELSWGRCSRCGAQEEINPFTGGVWTITLTIPVR